MNTNPFEVIDNRLSVIEGLLIEIKHDALSLKKAENEFSDLPEWLTRKQAAKILNVSLGTLDSWSREGRITKHRNAGTIRFKKSELLASFKSLKESKHSRSPKTVGR